MCAKPGDKRVILLVDDDQDVLVPMSILLEDAYRVATATGGGEALVMLEGEKVELVIADQRMPGMTGVELLTRVRERYPDIVRLVLTAYTDFDAMLKAINEGQVYRYIIKPWDQDDMRLTIRQALEWKDLRDSQGRLSAEVSEAHRLITQRNIELERAHDTILRQEKLTAVGQFAAEMAHEMNNHLQILLSANEEQLQRAMEDQQVIADQARMMVTIAKDIRDFSIDSTLSFEPKLTDPLESVEFVMRSCSYHPDFRHIKLRLDKEAVAKCRLDARQFKHMLMNLLKNAAHASPAGSEIVIYLDVGRDMVLKVVDHGKGIPEGRRDRVWEPFFTTNEKIGTGLGLSICRQVVEMHGGTIDFEETRGGGTTFTVSIPVH